MIKAKRRPKVKKICLTCGRKFPVWQSRIDIGKGKFCSPSCGKKGKFNHRWKGGIKKASGYVYIKNEKHPFATKKGYIKKSRLVMERFLNRYLNKNEIVHHKNNIRNDDRLENLELLMGQSRHLRVHIKGNKIWLGKRHTKGTIRRMKKSWTKKRKEKQSNEFSGKNNPNYRHGKYVKFFV